MSKPGDQTPSQEPDPNSFDPDTAQTLPEGAFDQTLVEEGVPPAPPDENATMVGYEPGAAMPGTGTDVGLDAPAANGDSSEVDPNATLPVGALAAPADDDLSLRTIMLDDPAMSAPSEVDPNATLPDGALAAPADDDLSLRTIMLDDPAMSAPSEVDPNATLPDGALAAPADDDLTLRTIMLDDPAMSAPSEDDFNKTLPDGALALLAEDDFAGKTIVMDTFGAGETDTDKTLPEGAFDAPVDAGATLLVDDTGAIGKDDGFGKTVQADAYGKTLATDGTVVMDDDFDGKTIVGADSAAEANVSASAGTQADPNLKRSGASGVDSRATSTGGKTSVEGTQVFGANEGDGIDKDSLNVAARSITGLHYGVVPKVDFKLVKQLGEGGMGVVYVARQQSLGREVVFKTLKPMAESQASKLKASGTMNSVNKHRTDMFLSEAVVTADLFHPNIVPIYELAKAPDGSLFYTMKWVRGDGWHNRLKLMTLEENLEVLMKVSDAMGFAHSRHIVNRDLKPENVMLGGYGETIVLDWGLALPFGEGKGRLPIATTAGLGSGTPAYMPPELITGPLARIGPACDIYLLGAMLFEVITGLPPHDFTIRKSAGSAGTVSAGAKMAEIRRVVVDNVIRETDPKFNGELLDIAMKAMATKPEDRYRTVAEFQSAIREYEKHASSHTLANRAKELTTVAAPTAAPVTADAKPTAEAPSVGYTGYQNALALYNESLREWTGNEVARAGLSETQLNFAKLALTKGDFDLGLSVLDTNADSHVETRTLLVKAREEREGRVRVMKILKWTAIGLLIGFAGVSAFAAKGQFDLTAANKKKVEAEQKAADATIAEKNAKEAEKKAFAAAKKAQDDTKIAEAAAKKAAEDTKLAEAAAMKAAEDTKIAVAAAMKAANDTKIAVAAAMKAEEDTKKAEVARAAADDAKRKAVEDAINAQKAQTKADYRAGLADASRSFFEGSYADTRNKLIGLKKKFEDLCGPEWDQLMNAASAQQAVSMSKPVESIGLSREGEKLILVAGHGDKNGLITVWEVDAAGKKIANKPIRELQLDSRLRVVAISPDGNNIAAAGDGGRIRVWSLKAEQNERPIELVGHTKAIYALKFSADGKQLVSGGDDRTVCLWSVADQKCLVKDQVLYAVKCVDWSRDRKWLVAGTSTPGDVSGVSYSWEVQSLAGELKLLPIRQFQVLPKTNSNVKGPDKSSADDKVKQNRGVVAIALTEDGKFAVSNGPTAELYLWEINPTTTGQKKNSLKVNTVAAIKLGLHSNRGERVRSVAFTDDGSRLLVAGDDGTISIWDRNLSGNNRTYEKQKKLILGHGGSVRGCLPLPRSPNCIISGSYDQHVHCLDLETYRKKQDAYDEFRKLPTATAFRPAESEVSVLDTPISSDNPGDGSNSESEPGGIALSSVLDIQAPSVEVVGANLPDDAINCGEEASGSDVLSEPVPSGIASRPIHSEFVRVSLPSLKLVSSQKPAPREIAAAANVDPSKSARFTTESDRKDESVGHTDSVFSAVFSRDGKRVLSASRDQTARAWSTETGRPILTMTGQASVFFDNHFKEGHDYDLFAMRFFPDGQRLLTSGFDGEMRIWDSRIDAGKSFGRELAMLPGTSMYGVMDISHDGDWILTAGRKDLTKKERGYSALLWNTRKVLASRQPTPELTLDNVHQFRVTTVAISPDNSRLITGDREGKVVLWDRETREVVGQPRFLHSGEVVKSEFLELPDGLHLLTAGVDRRVVLWKYTKSNSNFLLEKIRQFDHEGMIAYLAVSPLGKQFISVIRLSDKKTKANNTKTSNTKILLWNIESGKEQVIDVSSDTDSPTDRPPFPAWAANGTLAVITTAKGIIHFYDSVAHGITETWQVDNNGEGAARRAEPFAAILHPNEKLKPRHLITQTHNAALLWQLDGGANLVSFRPQGPVFSAGYSSDGRFVVTGGRSVRIFSADEHKITYGRQLHKIEYPHEGVATSVEFSPAANSFRFLTTSSDETAKIWDWNPALQVAQEQHTLKGHKGPIRFGTWSADGSRVLTVGDDSLPRVWSFPAGAQPNAIVLGLPEGWHPADFRQLCGTFSWDGQFVAVGGLVAETEESIGWIWNLRPVGAMNPKLYATVRGHGLGGINSVAFLPDDNRLLTGGNDGTARLWDWQKSAVAANDGKIIEADFLISLVRKTKTNDKDEQVTTTHRGAVTSVRVARDGNIVTASSDGTVLIWPK